MRAKNWLIGVTVLFLSGCATMMTGMTTSSYRDAPLVLAYSDPEIARDQNQVATLVLLSSYGLSIDGVSVREPDGPFNPELRVSRSGNTIAYIVDVLPGARKLSVTYDGIQQGSNNPDLSRRTKVGSGSVSATYNGPPIFSWMRTSEATYTLNAGEIFTVGQKMLSISGDIALYPLDAEERSRVIETRNKAEF